MPYIDVAATGNNIRRMGRERGLTVEDVRKACNLTTRNAIYQWMKGKNLPSVDNLVCIAYLYGTTIDCLIVTRG